MKYNPKSKVMKNDDHDDAHGYKMLITLTNDSDSVIIFGLYCPIRESCISLLNIGATA